VIDLRPGPWRIYAELAVVTALVASIGAQTARMDSAKATAAEACQQLSDERAQAATAALAATTAARVEETRRTEA
jgi:hypothetical protein